MMRITLKNGKGLNLIQVGSIRLEGKNVVYEAASNYSSDTVEEFDTEELAKTRYDSLINMLTSVDNTVQEAEEKVDDINGEVV